MDRPIPFFDLQQDQDDAVSAVRRVLRSGQFILGEELRAFEAEVCEHMGVKHAVGVGSGTDALVLGLMALGVKPGDEVITTSFTFIATVEAICRVGAVPVMVDIDRRSMTIDLHEVSKAVTSKTRAIVPVHLYGQPADMGGIMDLADLHHLVVLEDVAQALGAEFGGRPLGTIGHAGALSFYPTKNLGGCGDGGMVVTNSDDVAAEVRLLRVHGMKGREVCLRHGLNSRLDEIQTAILRGKLRKLAAWNKQRASAAAVYERILVGLRGVELPRSIPGSRHAWNLYTIRIRDGIRDNVQEAMRLMGVGTRIYYRAPVHSQPVFERMGLLLPQTSLAAVEVLSLPLWPGITVDEQERVADCLGRALEDAR